MKTLGFLLKKEFLQIRRNKLLLRMIIALPVIQLAFLPWAATFDQRNISLSIIDNDKSSHSTKLVEKILSSGFFRLTDYPASYSKALESVEKSESDIIIEIPADFEKNFVTGRPTGMMLSIDAVNGQKAGLGMSYISQIINDYTTAMIPSVENQSTIIMKPYYRYNTQMRYQDYMVPGVLVMLVTILGGMLAALNIVREKEIGTMEQINVTPVSKSVFILGKLIPFWIIGLIILTIGIFVGWVIYGLFPVGNILNIYLFAFLYLLALTGFGLIVSNFAQTQQQAMFLILFFLIIFILLSGLFTPITSMPDWAQKITIINPLRYFIEVIRLIYLKGSGLTDITSQIWKISIFVVVLNTFAIITYRKNTN